MMRKDRTVLLSPLLAAVVLISSGCIQPQPSSPAESIILAVRNAHAYDVESYNCHNYTLDAVILLNASGYDAVYVYAYNRFPDLSNHAWVRLYRDNRTSYRDYDTAKGLYPPDYSRYSETRECQILPNMKLYCP